MHYGQLSRLIELNQTPNITIQVIPFSSGVYMGQEGQFTIFEFPDAEDAPVAYQEGLFGDVYVEDSTDVARYTLAAARFREVALDASASTEFIRGLLKETG